MILVKVAKLGSRVSEVSLEEGQNVNAALEIAGVSAVGNIRVNGIEATDQTTLFDGDIITIVPKIKGGNIV